MCAKKPLKTNLLRWLYREAVCLARAHRLAMCRAWPCYDAGDMRGEYGNLQLLQADGLGCTLSDFLRGLIDTKMGVRWTEMSIASEAVDFMWRWHRC